MLCERLFYMNVCLFACVFVCLFFVFCPWLEVRLRGSSSVQTRRTQESTLNGYRPIVTEQNRERLHYYFICYIMIKCLLHITSKWTSAGTFLGTQRYFADWNNYINTYSLLALTSKWICSRSLLWGTQRYVVRWKQWIKINSSWVLTSKRKSAAKTWLEVHNDTSCTGKHTWKSNVCWSLQRTEIQLPKLGSRYTTIVRTLHLTHMQAIYILNI